MTEVVAFTKAHAHAIDLQEQQQYLANWLTDDMLTALEQEGWAYTLMDNGTPLGFAGVIPVWQGRGTVWAYISEHATGAKFVTVHKAVTRFLDGCFLHRLEMTVDCDFEAGHRWAKMLGFKQEAERMRGYRPDGGDCALYARVR